MRKYAFIFLLSLALLSLALLLLAGCQDNGGGGTPPPPNNGTVTISVSDPPTCAAPSGPYSHIYLTISDVKGSTSTDPNAADSTFVDLTPGLSPTQIDLLGAPNAQCLLATLGAPASVPVGSYKQFRVVLLANSSFALVAGNHCGTAANCVVGPPPLSSIQTLQLSSESSSGIRIPSSLVAGGQFLVAAGQTSALVLNFNACASIVFSSGLFHLSPVVTAGTLGTVTNSIQGTVVDSITKVAPLGGTIMVALEQNFGGIDRVVQQTNADATGHFVFCPVVPGTYDVVAVAINGAGLAYGATVTTGVAPATNLGSIPVIAETGGTTTQALMTGQINATTNTTGATTDVTLSALQAITVSGVTVQATIPLVQQASATANVTTVPGAGCPPVNNCVVYTLGVPALNPNVGAFNSGGTSYTQLGGPVIYTVDAQAFLPSSGGSADCTPSDLSTNQTTGSLALSVTAGTTVNPATLAFVGCK